MAKYRVIALSVGGLGRNIHHVGELVTDAHFQEGRAEELVKQKFLMDADEWDELHEGDVEETTVGPEAEAVIKALKDQAIQEQKDKEAEELEAAKKAEEGLKEESKADANDPIIDHTLTDATEARKEETLDDLVDADNVLNSEFDKDFVKTEENKEAEKQIEAGGVQAKIASENISKKELMEKLKAAKVTFDQTANKEKLYELYLNTPSV